MPGFGLARRRVLQLVAGGLVGGLARGAGAQQRQMARSRHLALVVLDPGHGGIDPGAIGAGAVFEKRITFATAIDLARVLRATRRFRIALTRGPDEYVPLRERVARARALRADLFMSIHADALPNPMMRGLSVFTLSAAASDREAAAIADSENREVVAGGRRSPRPREVSAILTDLAQRQTGNLSLEMAREVVAALGREVQLLDHPQRSAGFVVLSVPDIPSVLVELGCLSNPIEEWLLQQPAYRKRLARGLAEAIEAFFREQIAA